MNCKIHPHTSNVFYLNNFYTDYYLTKIMVDDEYIKLMRIKKRFCTESIHRLFTIKISDIPDTILTTNINYALMKYRVYNYNYEIKKREKNAKKQKNVEKLIFSIMVGVSVLIVII